MLNLVVIVDFGTERLLWYGSPSAWRRKPRHTSKTLPSTTPNPSRRGHQLAPPLCGLARVDSNSHRGFMPSRRSEPFSQERDRKKVEEEEKLQLVQTSLACVKVCRSSGMLSINRLVSLTNGASLLKSIDLPWISLQVPAPQRRTQRCASSAAASDTKWLWERLPAELGHQPVPG